MRACFFTEGRSREAPAFAFFFFFTPGGWAERYRTHALSEHRSTNRVDERRPEQLRALSIAPGFTAAALGSVLIATGKTRVLCTASLEPRTPPWLQHGGWITAEYAMLPGATNPRGRRDPGGRGKEIQRLIGRSLRAAVA